MKIAIDCDDAGINLKKALYDFLIDNDYKITDLDYLGTKKTDYPEIAFHLAHKILDKEYDRGILICGSGLGMAICANKVKGIFAGPCADIFTASRLRRSNNAQIIALGERVVGAGLAKMIVTEFLNSEFEMDKSGRKVEAIKAFERAGFAGQE
ncbi:MAG: RpiB/LacA/LacB family sugar-phosphate isomerase [Treponema sp.]|nr:RpiB/LacA/LacB family sugar-phosphate isomerase [Treponema sp.]